VDEGVSLPEPAAGARAIGRPESLVAGIGLVLVVVFALSFWLTAHGPDLREGVLLGALALAGIASLGTLRDVSESVRTIWRAVPVFCLLLIAGEGGRLLAGLLGADVGSRWLVSGSLELSAGSLLILASLRMVCGSSVISWSLGLLDLAMVGLASSVPWLGLFVLDRIGRSGGHALLPAVVSPALAVVTLVAAVIAFQTVPNLPALSAPLVLALGAGLAGDILISTHLLASVGITAAQGAWLGRALLISAAAIFAGGPASVRYRLPITTATVRLVVLIAAATVSLAYAGLAFERGDHLVGFIVTSAISVLLALRLLVHARERREQSAQLEQALREQEQLAVMDSLTGLYNRRFLDAELQLELDRSARTQVPVGVLLCDLDHFKEINDRYGHLVGDSVLREVARRLIGAVRNGDLVARYGGEEFVVLLPGGGKEQLREIGERCRLGFEVRPFRLPDGHEAHVTISIGGACWPEDAGSVRALVAAADAALYRAKEEGRNRIHIYKPGKREIEPEAAAPPLPERAPAAPLAPVSVAFEAAKGTAKMEAPPVEEKKMEQWAKLVARALGLDESAQRRCAMATRYYDVGKSALPESILTKSGPLSPVEWELIREHPEMGAALVELAPELQSIGEIVREHHERFDGRGYPDGKRESEISPEARIVACCDAWKAMRRERPYAPAKTAGEARAELLAGRGTQFDPEVVMTFLMFDEEDFEDDPVPAGRAGGEGNLGEPRSRFDLV
jgi:two-component system cell cycle response regulator